MNRLATILRDILRPDLGDAHHVAHRDEQTPELLLLSHGDPNRNGQAASASSAPTRQEVLNYLGDLAKQYHLPPKLVYAVADSESGFRPDLEVKNFAHDKHGRELRDKHGKPILRSIDYGLMQINSSNINQGQVKDASGRPFTIGDDVKSDWKANARAGVALLAPAYHLAELEQGTGATAEDHAQQAYSQYNSGKPKRRDCYLSQRKDGLPANGADRNFLNKYRGAQD